MQIWRIHLKPRSVDSVDPKSYCFSNRIVGVGWRAPISGPFPTPEEYISAAKPSYEHSQSWRSTINTICYAISPKDLIWTRDVQGNYYLGQIDGNWLYQDAQSNLDADVLNVRPCIWSKIGTAEAVPGKVATSFFSRRTIQRIHDEPVRAYSQFVFNNQGKAETVQTLKDRTYGAEIFSLMTSDDCEDLVGLYLQLTMGYLLVPSSCKSSTLNYEYSLVHQSTGKPAVVQVKAGSVTINLNDYSDVDADVYLCTTGGGYVGQSKSNIHVIEPTRLLDFLAKSAAILPQKIRNRLLLYQQLYSEP